MDEFLAAEEGFMIELNRQIDEFHDHERARALDAAVSKSAPPVPPDAKSAPPKPLDARGRPASSAGDQPASSSSAGDLPASSSSSASVWQPAEWQHAEWHSSADWQHEEWQQAAEADQQQAYWEAAKEETALAKQFQIPWKLRGPDLPMFRGEKFKQQSFREGTGRWANRGGSRREWFSCYYSALSAGAGKSEAAAHADKMHPPA